jgi:hypothetical protein
MTPDQLPKTRFLAHSLVHHDGKTQGEKDMRRFRDTAYTARMTDTLRRFPPTRVSIEEFEADMAAARAVPVSPLTPHEEE